MSLIQFICPVKHKPVPLDYCLKNRCLHPCHSLPALIVLASSRENKFRSFHVTELLNPPKIIILKRINTYAKAPESLAHTLFGRALHLVIVEARPVIKELGLEKEYTFEDENHFEVKIKTKYGTASISGTPDLIVHSKKQIWDYKSAKIYEIRDLLEGNWEKCKHKDQLNIYKVFGFPEAKELYLEMYIKDYKQSMKKEGILPIMVFRVPIMDEDYVKEIVKTKVEYLLSLEKNFQKVRDCRKDETWNGRRCKDYCDINQSCLQYLAAQGKRKKGKR